MNTKGSIFLILTALVMVVGIFAVNAYTAPLIQEARIQRENALYFDIVPEANGFGEFTPLTTPPSSVRSMVTMTQSGEDYVLVYDTTFKGWNEGIRMLFFVYADRLEVAGVRLISHDETIGIGDRLLENRAFQDQFKNLDANRLFDQGLDVIAGTSAPVTQRAVESALVEVLRYHQEFILGEVEIDTTPPIIRILALPTTFNEGSQEPNWESYFQVTNKDEVTVTINRGGLDMNQASDTPYVITATFTDPFGNSAQAQLNVTIVPLDEEIVIEIVEPREEILTLLLANQPAATYEDITEQYGWPTLIEGVYTETLNEQVTTISYEIVFTGWNPGIRLLVSIARATGVVSNVALLAHSETTGQRNPYGGELLANPEFFPQLFTGKNAAQLEELNLDAFSGATATRNAVVEALQTIVAFDESFELMN